MLAGRRAAYLLRGGGAIVFRSVVLASSVSLLLVACGGSNGPATGGGSRGETEAATDPDEATRAGKVYATVIRHLVTPDRTFGDARPPFEIVYVLDGAVRGAVDPNRATEEGVAPRPFPAETTALVRESLEDLVPVSFVRARKQVVTGEAAGSSPGRVVDGGVLVTLGRIEARGGRVTVATSMWVSGLAGEWATYVLESRWGRWRVTGTTGPVAIS